MNSTISVVIADDHPLFLEALSTVLKTMPGVGQVFPASDGRKALDLLRHHTPGLAILDLQMPGFSGIEIAERLSFELPETMIIMLSVRQDLPVVRQAIKLGVLGYLPKESEIAEIEEAINTVRKGLIYIPPSLAQRLAADQLRRPKAEVFTDREWNALQLIASHTTLAAMAEKLEISHEAAERLGSHVLYKSCDTSLYVSPGTGPFSSSSGSVT